MLSISAEMVGLGQRCFCFPDPDTILTLSQSSLVVMPESGKVSALERAMNLLILLVRAFAASMLLRFISLLRLHNIHFI